ncbi:MAG: N-acetyltransferase [Rubrivivax sp.]|nr:N-acetyltransferase [Rubrivivax sp.]
MVHDAARQCFETVVDGRRSVCAYRLQLGTMVFTHTEVPPALQGRGIAAALVAAALAHARERGLRVRPLCSYVAVYMRRHPETLDLLDA